MENGDKLGEDSVLLAVRTSLLVSIVYCVTDLIKTTHFNAKPSRTRALLRLERTMNLLCH